MLITPPQLLIEYKNYAHISTYVYKAEAALDASTSSGVKERARDAKQTASVTGEAPSTSGTSAQRASATQQTARADERDKVQSKLDYASALAFLSQQNYHKASQLFLKIGSAQRLGDWIGKASLISSHLQFFAHIDTSYSPL
jgi:COP9 signalosome complex subunit 1